MIETTRLDAAFARFEHALGQVEAVTNARIEESQRLKLQVGNADDAQREQLKLQGQLDQVRQKAAELVDTSKQAAGKIDTAMGRIRAVLHSNSGG